MAATKYLIRKYENVNGSWTNRGNEYITDETPQPYTITFPKNKSYADSEWKIEVQRYNDPTGCNSSGETYVTIPSGDTCFCTCDNVSYFYHVNTNQFPQSFGEGVTAKTFEIMTGYTQGCGTLSASTDSDLFENRQINIGYDPVTEKYTFSATVRANTSTGVRTGRAYIYFKSYFEGGEFLDCSVQIDFEQLEGEIETCELVASAQSQFNYTYGDCTWYLNSYEPKPVCTIPYNPQYGRLNFYIRYLTQTSWGGTSWARPEFRYTLTDNFGWSETGDSCGQEWSEVGMNRSTIDTRVFTLTILPYVQGGCDYSRPMGNRLISGTPCTDLEETFTIRQLPWGGCGCSQLLALEEVNLACDDYTQYTYGRDYYDYVCLTNDDLWYECWTVDDIDREGEYIESGGSQVEWIEIGYVHEDHDGYSFENGCLWYSVKNLKNYGDNDWTARATVHWVGVGENAGNTCTTVVNFTKVTDPRCAPSDCDCESYVSRVDKNVTLGSDTHDTATFGINTSSYYPCSYDITGITSLDPSVGQWCNIVINLDGKTGFISATSANNVCESRSTNFNMRLLTTNPDVPSCDYTLKVTQRGKCASSGCTDMYWTSGSSYSSCYSEYKTTGDTFHYIGDARDVYMCGSCVDSCLYSGGISLRHKPSWITTSRDGNRFRFTINENAVGQTSLSDTIQYNVGGSYCSQLDYTVNYDFVCNCDISAVHPEIVETGYTRSFPSTGGTQVVCKIDNYPTITSQTPCIVISATSTSQWDGTQGVVTNISIDVNGEVSVTCRANTTGVLIPFTIDFNEYDDTRYCGNSYHAKVDCDISG